MKIRRRLSQDEAEYLNLQIKENTGNQKPKYSISPKQFKKIQFLRIENKDVKSETKSNDYEKPFVLSAWNDKGYMMDIDEYCIHYKLPRNDVRSYKLVSHTGTPFYNIVFKEQEIKDDFDYLGELSEQLKDYVITKKTTVNNNNKIGVITLTDLHFGAYISAMRRTPDFSITILCDMLNSAAHKINNFNYKEVHLHLLGDLIESFTGLNHKNSWKGLDKGMFGVSAIKLFVELFDKHFISRVNNLKSVKLVAGNHDRTSSDNNEDTDGGVAELIAWGFELIGLDIEFSTSIITHKVDGICYILNHGHHPYTIKKTTEELCWEFGSKGMFNFIMEGHLHSRISKLNAKQQKNFTMISDDTIDCRRQVCPSLFTGNSYSEYGGWSTTAGFIISEANENKNGVNVFDFSL